MERNPAKKLAPMVMHSKTSLQGLARLKNPRTPWHASKKHKIPVQARAQTLDAVAAGQPVIAGRLIHGVTGRHKIIQKEKARAQCIGKIAQNIGRPGQEKQAGHSPAFENWESARRSRQNSQ